MPIVKDVDDRLTLRCINGCRATEQTPMRRHTRWWGLVEVEPTADGRLTIAGPDHQLLAGCPVRVFVCSRCGYVEMYDGTIAEPEAWKIRPDSAT